VHAAQAAIGGKLSLAGLIAAGPVGAIVASCTAAGLSAIFDTVGMSDDKKQQAVLAASTRNYAQLEAILDEGVKARLAASSAALSAESGGKKCLRSVHGTYLRAYDREWKVDMSPNKKAWEQWYVEDWKGRVVFKAIHSPGRFLCPHPPGEGNWVGLVDKPQVWEQFVPLKNSDGSWSFLSVHGTWLSAFQDGRVMLVERCDVWERFTLETW
jgi:hypothetical protein